MTTSWTVHVNASLEVIGLVLLDLTIRLDIKFEKVDIADHESVRFHHLLHKSICVNIHYHGESTRCNPRRNISLFH